MKRFARHLVPLVKVAGGVATLVLMSGCATTSAPTAAENDGIDHAKVQAIERAATRYGVKVYWINMPQQRKAAS